MAGKWELYTDKSGEYRFRLKAGNGEVIALSSEGYSSKSGALNGIDSIRRNVDSEIVETD
ncbi:YegP family protein [Microbacterium natoriense]|uniref:YegP family protein n=1 Tax=Microbacterium natoriense TaxID=284570 RepID=UPI0031D18830